MDDGIIYTSNDLNHPNYLPDRQALLRNDRMWWGIYFGPGLRAYYRKDFKTLKAIVKKYQKAMGAS